MIFSGLEMVGEIPFSHVIIHTTVLAADGRRMSKSLGTGFDPLDLVAEHGADATRYGLLKMSSSQDVRFAIGAIEEGRKLANKLWNASRLLLGAGPREGEPSPEAVEERWIYARLDETRREVDADLEAFDFAHAVDRPLPRHLRRLLRLVPRGDQAAPRRAAGPRDGHRRARAAAQAAAPGDAPRDRGDLVAPARPRHAADRRAVARARRAFAADLHALDRAQEAAAIFRRSGVRAGLDGDDQRIFDAVVRPERAKTDGNAEAELERLRKEIARAERHARQRAVHLEGSGRGRRGRAREARALPP